MAGLAQRNFAQRVLIVSSFFTEGHGGTPESILLLAQQLAPLGISCDVTCNRGVCRDAGARNRLPAADDVSAFGGRFVFSDYGAVFVAGSWNLRAPALVLRAWLAGLPVVYAAKGCLSRIEFTRLRDLRRIPYLLLVEGWLLLAARHVVVSSRAESDDYVMPSWLWRRKMALIPEPFQGGAIAARPKREGRTVGFLAEISPRKGLLELIAGFGAFLAKHPGADLHLRVAGGPRAGAQNYFAQCKALATRNGSASRIAWCAPVRGASRDEFYAGIDLFVCPSRFESFGLTVLESLWQGTPVLAGARLGVLESLKRDAPVLKLASLQEQDISSALGDFAAGDWPQADPSAWAGRHAAEPSNRDIAMAFAQLFLPAAVR